MASASDSVMSPTTNRSVFPLTVRSTGRSAFRPGPLPVSSFCQLYRRPLEAERTSFRPDGLLSRQDVDGELEGETVRVRI
jgi:hypothetical protein